MRLIGRDSHLRTIALVDSGATSTFVPPELAEAVGMETVRQGESAEGAGGKFLNDIAVFRFDLLHGSERVYQLECESFVPKDPDRIPYVVLGRDSIFKVYDITFRENQEIVAFRPARGR